jgi:hypothetical protein
MTYDKKNDELITTDLLTLLNNDRYTKDSPFPVAHRSSLRTVLVSAQCLFRFRLTDDDDTNDYDDNRIADFWEKSERRSHFHRTFALG